MTKKAITDTTQLSSQEKLSIAATGGGIVAQEAAGQRELAASAQLPIKGLIGADRPRWEAAPGQPILAESRWHSILGPEVRGSRLLGEGGGSRRRSAWGGGGDSYQ